MFFSLKKDSRTRGHEVKLVKDQYRLDIRKHSFSQRTINEWNKLSTDCVTASSVNMFKNKELRGLKLVSDGELCQKKCCVHTPIWPPSWIYIYVFHRIFLGIINGSISTKKHTQLE